MTMAALQALALRDCLDSGDDGLARRFFASSAQPIAQAWARNRSNERVPVTTGMRSWRKRLRSKLIEVLWSPRPMTPQWRKVSYGSLTSSTRPANSTTPDCSYASPPSAHMT